jgi:hypothetical protein
MTTVLKKQDGTIEFYYWRQRHLSTDVFLWGLTSSSNSGAVAKSCTNVFPYFPVGFMSDVADVHLHQVCAG